MSKVIQSKFEPDDLLTKTEFRELFCEKMRISKSTYYRCFHKDFKVKYYGLRRVGKNIGKESVGRIPYKIAVGLIHLVQGRLSENDPPIEELKKYLA